MQKNVLDGVRRRESPKGVTKFPVSVKAIPVGLALSGRALRVSRAPARAPDAGADRQWMDTQRSRTWLLCQEGERLR
jgi:hypothetical protein